MWTAYNGHVDCVRELLSFGADLQFKDNERNKTALDYARQQGRPEVVALLEGARIEHERFLAQLGSQTKPALRESLQPVVQAAEGDQQPAEAERVILVLDAQLVETGVEPASTEEAGPILPEGNEDAHSRGEWPEAGVGRPEVQPKVIPAMPLDLSDLYLELAK
eukprot:m.369684 g.369684  ORF g.369684 m.369684 type:complete len:164 (+) comp56118_c0_seq20:430-921(+)